MVSEQRMKSFIVHFFCNTLWNYYYFFLSLNCLHTCMYIFWMGLKCVSLWIRSPLRNIASHCEPVQVQERLNGPTGRRGVGSELLSCRSFIQWPKCVHTWASAVTLQQVTDVRWGGWGRGLQTENRSDSFSGNVGGGACCTLGLAYMIIAQEAEDKLHLKLSKPCG